MRSLVILAFGILSTQMIWAEDWTTTDGKTYLSVKVVKVEDDAITILYKNGGALVPMAKLPPPLQTKYSYDPEKARVAADARAKADAENAKALQAEINQADKLKHQKLVDESKPTPKAKAPTGTPAVTTNH